jgi:hypothetical protein
MGNGHKEGHYHTNTGKDNMKAKGEGHLRTGGEEIVHNERLLK